MHLKNDNYNIKHDVPQSDLRILLKCVQLVMAATAESITLTR